MLDKRRAKFLIDQELDLFPIATMTDIYKLFYQNCCGSSHFLPDLSTIKENIASEIDGLNNDSFIYPDYDISYIFKVSRISLYSIQVGKYDLNYVADRFVELSVNPQRLSLHNWIIEWQGIRKLLISYKPYIIDDLPSSNSKIGLSVHHSNTYRINYKPHYRICNI